MDSFKVRSILGKNQIIDFQKIAKQFPTVRRMPVSHRIILENLFRNENGVTVTTQDIEKFIQHQTNSTEAVEVVFYPSRIVMQDYAGMPALVDLAALRDTVAGTLDVSKINPRVPTDLVIDHSLIVHSTGSKDSQQKNLEREYKDNAERFLFLKWAQAAMTNLRIIPPGQGIIHQINIEYLAEIVASRKVDGHQWLLPDTVIGTDSHTTMVNGLGVLGWGVGGIEAEAVMLGEPVSMLLPPVLGVHLTGEVAPGILATDLVLSLTEFFRNHGVVGSILEFFGSGYSALSVADRVTISNMCPEFGATAAFFPVDVRTIEYLHQTGRSAAHLKLIETYLRHNEFWFEPELTPEFADIVEFDLSLVGRSVAGPRRPEQRLDLNMVPQSLRELAGSRAVSNSQILNDGDIVIAAITSCTNTSNPEAMIAAGLLARNALARGLAVDTQIKTSLAPGSKVVSEYLERAGLAENLAALGFEVVGFGCATCVGNSGDIDPALISEIVEQDICVASILSGNRNFEGRIHEFVKANYLASPPLVVAFALAGTILKDLTSQPLGRDQNDAPVYLHDIWPDSDEIANIIHATINRDLFVGAYKSIFDSARWDSLSPTTGKLFAWDDASTYLQRPPFFDLAPVFKADQPLLSDARPLLMLGDSVTTDHISPVGAIPASSTAGEYLDARGVVTADFNAYGARRGNHEVMVRGTFANTRLNNKMTTRTGGYTLVLPDKTEHSVFEASLIYNEREEEVILVAGKMYGTGSARDWAAKGTRLLGVRVVIAESFERIHRANLVRMGILPLQFANGLSSEILNLHASDTFSIKTSIDGLAPLSEIEVMVKNQEGITKSFVVICRADTVREIEYIRVGGVLPMSYKM